MSRSEGKTGCAMLLLYVFLWVAGIIGWCMNVYKFTQCDFKEPYKTEIIRGVGIFTGPVGSIMGFMTIGDEH